MGLSEIYPKFLVVIQMRLTHLAYVIDKKNAVLSKLIHVNDNDLLMYICFFDYFDYFDDIFLVYCSCSVEVDRRQRRVLNRLFPQILEPVDRV